MLFIEQKIKLLIILLSILLISCGQSGPLKLPNSDEHIHAG